MITADLPVPGPGERQALALRQALSALADHLREPSPPAEAVRTLVALDEALAGVDTLNAGVAGLVAAAGPGEVVRADVERRTARLSAYRTQLSELRALLEHRYRLSEEEEQAEREHQELRRRQKQIKRARQAHKQLPRLRDAVARMEQATASLAAETVPVEEKLRDAVAAFLEQAEPFRSLLEEQTGQAYTRAREITEELGRLLRSERESERVIDERTREAADARQRLDVARAAMEDLLAQLRRHAEADRLMAEALGLLTAPPTSQTTGSAAGHPPSAVDQVLAPDRADVERVLLEVEERLAVMDRALGELLRLRAPAREVRKPGDPLPDPR